MMNENYITKCKAKVGDMVKFNYPDCSGLWGIVTEIFYVIDSKNKDEINSVLYNVNPISRRIKELTITENEISTVFTEN